MSIVNRIRSTYEQMTQESASLQEWRDWLSRVLMLVGSIALPPSMLFTFPVFIAERQYGLVAFDIAIWILFVARLFSKGGTFRFRAYLWLAVLYCMAITYYVALGPHYARSAWFVSCAVMAALLFGMRAALVSTAINTAMLIALYWLIAPDNPAWLLALTDSWQKWAMFVVNLAIVTLVASLPVGFLLDHLNRALERGQKAHHELAVESVKLQGVMESLPGVFYMCDQGRLVRWNRRLEEALGYSGKELENIRAPDLFAAEDRERIAQAAERASTHGQAEEEVLFATKEGRKIAHYWVGSRVMVGNRPHLVGMAIDITDRLQADRALRESEERLQLSLQAADLGLWDLDMRTNEIVVNPHWVEILGYTMEELDPHISTWQELTHPEDLARVREAVDAHVQHQTPFYATEYRLRSASGQWEWVSARGKVVEWSEDGEPLRMAGTHLLISERKQAEQELQKHRDHLEELVQERTTELRRVVNLMAGREVRMAELKETIRGLRAQLEQAGIVPVERRKDDDQEDHT